MKIKEIFLTILVLAGLCTVILLYNEKQEEKLHAWQSEYAKAMIKVHKYKSTIWELTDTIICLNAQIAKREPIVLVKKEYIKVLKDRLVFITDTARIIDVQKEIIIEQDTTIALLDSSLTDCIKLTTTQEYVLQQKDSIIAEQDKLILIANKNATPTFYQRNKFWLGLGAGVATVVAVLSVR